MTLGGRYFTFGGLPSPLSYMARVSLVPSHIRVPLSEALMNLTMHNWQAIYFEGENTKGLIQSIISLLYFFFYLSFFSILSFL